MRCFLYAYVMFLVYFVFLYLHPKIPAPLPFPKFRLGLKKGCLQMGKGYYRMGKDTIG
jgi:hypothetical protein